MLVVAHYSLAGDLLDILNNNLSTTVHPIDFTLGECVSMDPRECSVG